MTFNALKNLTIKVKLYSGFGVLVALCVALSAFAIMEFNSIGDNVGKMSALSDNAIRALEVDEFFEKMRRSGLRYAYDHDEPSLKENGEVAASAIETLKEAAKATLSEERRKIYNGLQDEIATEQKSTAALADAVHRSVSGKATLTPAGDKLTANTEKLVELVKAGGDQSAIFLATKIESDLLKLRVANWRSQAVLDPKGQALVKDTADKALAAIASLEKADSAQNVRAAIGELKTSVTEYAAVATATIAALISTKDIYANDLSPKVRNSQGTIIKAKNQLLQDFGNTRTFVSASIASTVTLQTAVAGVVVLFAGVMAWLISRGISNPIRALTAGMRELAAGNFGVVLAGLGRKDEIGDIAGAVEEFKVKAAEKAQRDAEEKAEQEKIAAADREAASQKMAAEFEAAVGGIVQAAVAGDFSQRVDLTGKTGLVLNVGTSLNSLCQNVAGALDDLIEMLNSLAEGDLTKRITAHYEGNFAQLKDNANKTAERIGSTIAEIKTATREVTNASTEITTSTTDLSQRTEEQAASLEQTSSSMEEIAATVKKNAENAQQVNQAASTTRDVAVRGSEVVASAVTAMAKIEESSGKISDIIGVIDEIARQTNLLALNAAVEAARAGEAGRGFAVVASEVRSLAQRSAQAAKDIKDLITDSTGLVKEGVDLVNRAGTSLDEIVGSIKKVADVVADIAAASAEQSSGIEQVNKALTQMDEVTQQNSALVEENAATARTLEQQAKAMDDRVAFFRVEEGAASGSAARATTATSVQAKAKPARQGGRASVGHPPVAGNTALKIDADWQEF